MEANLHLHSRFSDGSLWPEELARAVAATGLELAALTDHDSLGGSREFQTAAAAAGFATVAGCEIDCSAPDLGYRSEILAYFPEGSYAQTEAFLEALARGRAERLFAWLESARSLFDRPDLAFDDLLARKYGERAFSIQPWKASLNKVDFWLYLRSRGVIDASVDYKDFRKTWLDSGRIAGPKTRQTTVKEVAAVVRRDGGHLVLPHIGHEFGDSALTISKQAPKLRAMLEYFKGCGVGGVELYWYRKAEGAEINELVAREAGRLGLFLTYGSDCHGPGSGKHTLGDFSGDFAGFPAVGSAVGSRPEAATPSS